jgi:hypothetical protein
MTVVQRALVLTCLLTLASCGEAGSPARPATPAPTSAHAHAPAPAPRRAPTIKNTAVAHVAAGDVPVLSAREPSAPERTDPPAVQRRFARERTQALAALRRIQRARPSAAAGCQQLRGPVYHGWGPPTPTVQARVLGHQVAIEFAFDHLPTSPACRPATISAAVFSGRPATSSYNALGAIAEFPLAGPRGRFVVPLPGGSPPYHVGLYVVRLDGVRSNQVVLPLPCRGACLPPGPPRQGLPTPLLAPRGVTRRALQRSVTQAVGHAQGFPRPTGTSCASVRACAVTWIDRDQSAHYTVRYAVAGERVRGCWIAREAAVTGRPPHWFATVGNGTYLGGCVDWAR